MLPLCFNLPSFRSQACFHAGLTQSSVGWRREAIIAQPWLVSELCNTLQHLGSSTPARQALLQRSNPTGWQSESRVYHPGGRRCELERLGWAGAALLGALPMPQAASGGTGAQQPARWHRELLLNFCGVVQMRWEFHRGHSVF